MGGFRSKTYQQLKNEKSSGNGRDGGKSEQYCKEKMSFSSSGSSNGLQSSKEHLIKKDKKNKC